MKRYLKISTVGHSGLVRTDLSFWAEMDNTWNLPFLAVLLSQ